MTVNGETPKVRALGARLREIREQAGIGLRQLAKQLDIDPSALSRYETGQRSPRLEDVASILTALGVNGAARDELVELAREPRQPAWLAITLPGHRSQLAALLDFERAAAALVDVSPLLVPGLLQTADYARAIMSGGGLPEEEVPVRVSSRLGRRDVLTRRNPVRYRALLGEAALRQVVGDRAVMADQLRHLLAFAELSNVDIRVVPFESGWHPGLEGAFFLIEFGGGRAVVHIENRRSGLYLHEKADVAAYRKAMAAVFGLALSKKESGRFIAAQRDRMEAAWSGGASRVSVVRPPTA